MAPQGIERRLVFHSQDALDALLTALENARGRVTSAQAVRITELQAALVHGNAPAGEPGPDNTPDMSVTVTWPLRRGEMQAAVFDRDGGPEPDTLTNSDRVILRAMLELARCQVPAPDFGGEQ